MKYYILQGKAALSVEWNGACYLGGDTLCLSLPHEPCLALLSAEDSHLD